jgi:DHA2 family multidrug resistance protein
VTNVARLPDNANAPTTQRGSSSPKNTTNPYIGIVGVFLGAGLATLNARLLSVGLPDLRGALGLGFDEASWLPTALNMATMFSGCFVVFLATIYGIRRILLPTAGIFALISLLLPLASGYWPTLALIVIAGLTSGTFYSLTLTFVLNVLPKKLIIFGIAAYAADIVFVSNFASGLEGWYIEHLSWHWIFWTASGVAPVMMTCVYFGIPRQPLNYQRPSWRGFVYFSLGFALLYGALDQGERLYWLNSGVVVAMIAAGALLVGASVVRRAIQPHPMVKLSFLNNRDIVILALGIVVFKFTQMATVVLMPSFLANIRQYRPLETGHALAWVELPIIAVVWLVAVLIIYTDSRLVLVTGLAITAAVCWLCANIDTAWAGRNFSVLELALSVGFACGYIGLVSSVVLAVLEAGGLSSAANAATASGFMHFVRIFGGQVGGVCMARFLSVREQFHSNLLGLHVQIGSWLTDDRLRILGAGLAPSSAGPGEAQFRAVGVLAQQVKAQAYTLATSDSFLLIGWVVAAYLLLMLFLRPGRVNFQMLRKMK